MVFQRTTIVIWVVCLAAASVLFALTVTDWRLDWSEQIRLQRPGLYPVADESGEIVFVEGLPYVSQWDVMLGYGLILVLLCAVATVIERCYSRRDPNHFSDWL